ncbi:unnamed protein product [Trichogramma brassicae]|uniref:Uncharacterized protein n=1 Tax=Trichogramma brassicae TaxID=86971 RepID=A0A6H5JB87_9HYME|nr:unnamed protein product [Trichogramma brassicae]
MKLYNASISGLLQEHKEDFTRIVTRAPRRSLEEQYKELITRVYNYRVYIIMLLLMHAAPEYSASTEYICVRALQHDDDEVQPTTPAAAATASGQVRKISRTQQRNQLQSSANSVDDASTTTTLEIPIDLTELLRIIGEGSTTNGNSKNNGRITAKQMLALDRYADKIMKDERVMSYVQDRIKRDHTTGYDYAPPPPHDSYGPPAPVYGPPPAQHHGGGSDSASFFTGLVGGLIGSSASLSKGSVVASAQGSHAPPALPQHHPVVYGPPAPVYGPPKYPTYGHHEHHEHHQVTPWDLKKAIINSLIQAVKAVGGGFLALNGQIIKGSGFLVQTKGRLISGAGEAISGLGKTLATGATKPTTTQHHHTTSYEHHGYAYGPPPVVHNHYAGECTATTLYCVRSIKESLTRENCIDRQWEESRVKLSFMVNFFHFLGHDHHYAGAPPPTDSYQHGFGAATDVHDDSQAGLLVAQPVPDLDHLHHHQHQHQHQSDDGFEVPPQQDDAHVEYQTFDHGAASGVDDGVAGKSKNEKVKEAIAQLAAFSAQYKKNKGTKTTTSTSGHQHSSDGGGIEVPTKPLQLQDYNQESHDLYPPLGNGPADSGRNHHHQAAASHGGVEQHHYTTLDQVDDKYKHPPITIEDTYLQHQHHHQQLHHQGGAGYGQADLESPHYAYVTQPHLHHHQYGQPRPHHHKQISFNIPDVHFEISDEDITGFEKGAFEQPHHHRHPFPTMDGPLKIPIIGPYSPHQGFPPAHLNSIHDIGIKYPGIHRPSFEIKQSIGYEIANRRDDRESERKVNRL